MNIEIPDEDASLVRAILLTHAEMQDRQTIENEQLQSRPGQDKEMVATLKDIHEDLIEDRDNLKRIADFFGKN